MKNLTLEAIASACGGQYVGEESLRQKEIKGAVTDSRQVAEDYLFIPVKGERVDGHDFIPAVFDQGALAALSEKPLTDCPGPYILVGSTLKALKDIAAYYRSQLTIPIIGITGSVGKTSTKEMIASVLSVKYKVLKTAGNLNNEIGLPLTILRIQEEHEAAVVEMGISDFEEMHRLAAIARPDICVMTNIGYCHLEHLIDRDGVLRAKTEMFEHIKKGAAVFLNGDDDKLATIKEAGGNEPMFYGLGKKSTDADGAELHSLEQVTGRLDIFMDKTENLGLKGTRARLHTPQGEIALEIPIPGEHNLYNAMAAAGVGLRLGLTLAEIQAGIAAAKTIRGRTNLVEAGGLLIVDDCYNANPMSMKASLDVLKTALGRKIAVLGDMGELGEDEKQLHHEVGAYAVNAGVDVLFCVGELSREMERGAWEAQEKKARQTVGKSGGAMYTSGSKATQIYDYATKEEMLPNLLSLVKAGDTVLVKASHFMGFPEVVEALRNR